MRRLGLIVLVASALSVAALAGTVDPAFAYAGPPPWQSSSSVTSSQAVTNLRTILLNPVSAEASTMTAEAATGLTAARVAAGVLPPLTTTNLGVMGAALTAGWFIGSGINRFVGISAAISGTPAPAGPIIAVDRWQPIDYPLSDPYQVGPFNYGGDSGTTLPQGWVLTVTSSGDAGTQRWGATGCSSPSTASHYSFFEAQTVGTFYSHTWCGGSSSYGFRAILQSEMPALIRMRTSAVGASTPAGTTSSTYGYTAADLSSATYSSAALVAARAKLDALSAPAQLAAGQAMDPTWTGPVPATITMPSCSLRTYAECVADLRALGWLGDATSATETAQAANLALAPLKVTRVMKGSEAVGVGSTFLADDALTLYANPSPLPLELQAQLANEAYGAYLTRIGHTGAVTVVVLDPAFADGTLGPSMAVKVTFPAPAPSTGSLTLPVPKPGEAADTSPAHRVGASSSVTVYVNPPGMPPMDGSSSGGGGITWPAIDSPCDKFPFGVFCWVGGALSAIVTADPEAPYLHLPEMEVPLPGVVPGTPDSFTTPDLLLSAEDVPSTVITGFDVIALCLVFWVWLHGLWFVGSRLLVGADKTLEGPGGE